MPRVDGPSRPLQIHVLALRDCTPLVPIGVVELLRKASALAPSVPGAPRRQVEITLVSPGSNRTVRCAGGLELRCGAFVAEVRRSDLVVAPALDPDVLEHLEANREVVPWLRKVHEGGADAASVCTGAFLLGEAGLLDGRAATTHWAFQEQLARRYPRVRVEPQAILVDPPDRIDARRLPGTLRTRRSARHDHLRPASAR
jgi:transcriptional regulator GlxA family with amidase domain